jgi:hypothetical protein
MELTRFRVSRRRDFVHLGRSRRRRRKPHAAAGKASTSQVPGSMIAVHSSHLQQAPGSGGASLPGGARHSQPDHGDDVALDLIRPTPEGEDRLTPGLLLEPTTQRRPRRTVD